MADANAPAGTSTPAATDPSTQTPAPPPAAPPPAPPPAAAAPPAGQRDPGWLNQRLTEKEQATTAKLLKEIGVTDVAAAKQAIADYNARVEAGKTAEQKAADLAAAHTTATTELERYRLTTAEYAARMLDVLEPEQQAAVRAIAGDDPAAQLRTITALAPTWKVSDDAAPVNTSPPPNAAPAGTQPAATPDPKTQYEQLKQGVNPFRRAAYGLANPQVYNPKQ